MIPFNPSSSSSGARQSPSRPAGHSRSNTSSSASSSSGLSISTLSDVASSPRGPSYLADDAASSDNDPSDSPVRRPRPSILQQQTQSRQRQISDGARHLASITSLGLRSFSNGSSILSPAQRLAKDSIPSPPITNEGSNRSDRDESSVGTVAGGSLGSAAGRKQPQHQSRVTEGIALNESAESDGDKVNRKKGGRPSLPKEMQSSTYGLLSKVDDFGMLHDTPTPDGPSFFSASSSSMRTALLDTPTQAAASPSPAPRGGGVSGTLTTPLPPSGRRTSGSADLSMTRSRSRSPLVEIHDNRSSGSGSSISGRSAGRRTGPPDADASDRSYITASHDISGPNGEVSDIIEDDRDLLHTGARAITSGTVNGHSRKSSLNSNRSSLSERIRARREQRAGSEDSYNASAGTDSNVLTSLQPRESPTKSISAKKLRAVGDATRERVSSCQQESGVSCNPDLEAKA